MNRDRKGDASIGMPIESLQSIHLESDRSGKIFHQLYFQPTVTQAAKWFAAQGWKSGFESPADETRLRELAGRMGHEVDLVMARPEENGKGWKGHAAMFTFRDINRISIFPGAPLFQKASDKKTSREPVTFAHHNDLVAIKLPIKSHENTIGEEQPVTEQESKPMPSLPGWATSMIGGFRIATAIVCETGIADSNASFRNGNTLSLLDISPGNLFDTPDIPALLGKVNRSGHWFDIRSLFGDVTGIKIETQPILLVRLNAAE